MSLSEARPRSDATLSAACRSSSAASRSYSRAENLCRHMPSTRRYSSSWLSDGRGRSVQMASTALRRDAHVVSSYPAGSAGGLAKPLMTSLRGGIWVCGGERPRAARWGSTSNVSGGAQQRARAPLLC